MYKTVTSFSDGFLMRMNVRKYKVQQSKIKFCRLKLYIIKKRNYFED